MGCVLMTFKKENCYIFTITKFNNRLPSIWRKTVIGFDLEIYNQFVWDDNTLRNLRYSHLERWKNPIALRSFPNSRDIEKSVLPRYSALNSSICNWICSQFSINVSSRFFLF